MAIGFIKSRYISRSSGGNSCRSSAYNARSIITDKNIGVVFNFANKKDNIYHEVLLPDYVSKEFKNISILSNVVEQSEHRKDSQLYIEWVLALPKEESVTLEMQKELIYRFIEYKGWVKEGLGVQIDIHIPHEGEENVHTHLLFTTRRFNKSGFGFELKKARDLQPKVAYQKVIEETQDSIAWTRIQNDYYKEYGLELRVDLPGEIAQEHIGPVRMRSVLNQAVQRNIERRQAEIEHLSSGARVLEKVTRYMSVFNQDDLSRAVKDIDNPEKRAQLVAEALADKSVIKLFREDGDETGYFTTVGIRQEENKILRLSSYVANNKNVFSTSDKAAFKSTIELITQAASRLTEEQHIALTNIITAKSALQILRGRAGVGKSHVLGEVAEIAKALNIEVIGIAPTHKAKEALSNAGFERTDTIKGMLFKLANGRFSLPKHSLLVVDEVGMIGNDDFSELLRVAATRQCSVILSGDERQLSSVQRGGMFEVLADKHGSNTILDIKRQAVAWGRSVAMAFSQGEVVTGVAILGQEERINWQEDITSSMQVLLTDWHVSSYEIEDRLILAVKNKDVAALNHGVRQYLKLDGKLTGQEFIVAGNHYMQGDRILITSSNKDLGLVNGDLGVILEASKDRFIVSMNSSIVPNYDNQEKFENKEANKAEGSKIIEFNPAEYNDFRHGYATTVFKAQGASIKDVYVCHNGFAVMRNSYVALSRNINELKLYVNSKITPSRDSLIKQLSYDPEVGSSLNFLTEGESKVHQQNTQTLKNISIIDNIMLKTYDFIESKITKLVDQYLPEHEYYNYQEPSKVTMSVEQVLDKIYEQNENMAIAAREEKLVVGSDINSYSKTSNTDTQLGEMMTLKTQVKLPITPVSNIESLAQVVSLQRASIKQSAKDRFYAKVDYQSQLRQQEENRERYKGAVEALRSELVIKAESVAHDLLGSPNRKLSNKSTLKYGNKGSLALKVSGSKAGTWYDFELGKGGDLFDLVQREKGCDFKESVSYLQNKLGISRHNLSVVEDHEVADKYVSYRKQQAKDKDEERGKIRKAEDLYARSKPLECGSTVWRYLSQTRNIAINYIDFAKYSEKYDVRESAIYEKSLNKQVPALVAFARDVGGNITGGQQILLDSKTSNKEMVEVAKRSFGKITGSFVEISNLSDNHDNLPDKGSYLDQITIIAEGLETALSLQHSDVDGRILCALGINNIKNYPAKENEKIIIAADNDGAVAVTNKTILEASNILEQQGAIVEVVRPDQVGDFNDILQKDRVIGPGEILNIFKQVINALQAKTLDEFLKVKGESYLPHQVRGDLSLIKRYAVSEQQILQGFLRGYDKGIDSIQKIKSDIAEVEEFVVKYCDIVAEIKKFDERSDHCSIVGNLVNTGNGNANSYLDSLHNIRKQALTNYLSSNLAGFSQQITQANTVSDIINIHEQRQSLLISLAGKLTRSQDNELIDNMLKEAKILAQTKVIEKLPKTVANIVNHNLVPNKELVEMLKYSTDLTATCHGLEKKHEEYCIKSHLAKLAKAKQEAKSPNTVLKALEKEQEYLASLHGKMQDSYYHGSSLAQSVKYAARNNKDNIITQLHKLTAYLDKPSVKHEHITNIIKTSTHSGEALHNLTKQYHKHVISELKSCLEHIYDHKELTLDGHKFIKPLQLMDYVLKKHEHNEFFPREHIQNGRNNYAQYQKEISKSKEFGGPSL